MTTNLNIIIRNRNAAFAEVVKETNFWNVISIRSPDEKNGKEPIDFAIKKCKDILILEFDDIQNHIDGYTKPTKEPIVKAINWAKDKQDILVHCHAGISRSSAMAYLICCDRYKDPSKAIKILDPKYHWPNTLIVKLGSEILNNKEVWKTFIDWRSENIKKTNGEIIL